MFRTGSSTGYPHQISLALANGAIFNILLITMLSNYYTLAVLAADLDRKLRERTIREAYTQDKNEIVLSFHELPEVLLVSCLAGVNTLYLHPSFSRSRKNSTDVLKQIAGKTILSVTIQPMDRVISFCLQDGLTIHACFFGSKANVLVVDRESRIIEAFKEARSVVGETYSPSPGKILQDPAALRTLVAGDPHEKIFTLLKHASPTLGSTLATEILFRSNVPVISRAEEITAQKLDLVEHSFSTVLTELTHPASRVYVSREAHQTPFRFSLVKLEHCHEYEERPFPDVHSALRFFISRSRSSHDLQSGARNMLAALHQIRTKLQRTMSAVEADLETTSRADEYERYARVVMASLPLIPKGVKSIELEENGESRVTVPLDPKLSPVQNAQRYFEKGKKSRIAYEQSRKRLVEMRESLRLVESLLNDGGAMETPEELKRFQMDHAGDLERLGIGEKAKKREQLPFRVFTVDGGYEVWAGKSSRNNDELTLKFTKPNDLWFHARGGSGSHVVLKAGTGKGEPSKKAREQAAGIAAYYSKMRNARMVPVAMTERKYVRKPKGVPPGTVVLDREKVIFAEPGLPQ